MTSADVDAVAGDAADEHRGLRDVRDVPAAAVSASAASAAD